MFKPREIKKRYSKFDIYVLWTSRNPLDVYSSHWAMVNGLSTTEHPLTPDDSIIDDWITRNQSALNASNNNIFPILFLNYDEISAGYDPRDIIFEFCGLRPELLHNLVKSIHSPHIPKNVVSNIIERTSYTYESMKMKFNSVQKS